MNVPHESAEQHIVIGSDHAGFELKELIETYLSDKGFVVNDTGCHSDDRVDYPEFAARAVQTMQKERIPQCILVCGSGIGVSIAANRFPGARAVLANDTEAAKWSRLHNNANILCMGGRVITPETAYEIIDVWLATPFEGGRHEERIRQLDVLGAEILGYSRAWPGKSEGEKPASC